MRAERRPGAVPDAVAADGHDDLVGADVQWGTDTDGDGRADTLLRSDGPDLLVLTDLDADGLADRVVRIGPDGQVHAGGQEHADGQAHPGDHPAASGTGSAAAVPALWAALLRLCGLHP